MAELAAPAVRDWDFPRSAASVALISRFGAERGLGVDAMLRGTALDPARLRDPELQVDARQELAVVRNLVRAVGERADSTALDLGCRYRVTTFGIFGFACVSSPTLRDAMTFALRYLDLSFTFCIPRVAVEGDVITLTMHDDKVPGDVARFLVLRDLSAIVTVLRDLLPAIELRTLTFRHPTPSTTDSYHKVFRIVPVFSAPSCATTIDAGFLGHPLPQANEHTVAICEAQCRAMVTRRRRRSGIAHEVRERLIRVGGVDSGMDEVARWLAMSPAPCAAASPRRARATAASSTKCARPSPRKCSPPARCRSRTSPCGSATPKRRASSTPSSAGPAPPRRVRPPPRALRGRYPTGTNRW